jgi:hypothetical protein
MFEKDTEPEEVAKVILKAVTSGNNKKFDLRYLVCSDAISLIEKRKSMSEREFSEFIYHNILGSR